jgi:hypothetical protein
LQSTGLADGNKAEPIRNDPTGTNWFNDGNVVVHWDVELRSIQGSNLP